MADVLNDLQREVQEIVDQAASVDRDSTAITATLDRLTALYEAIEDARRDLAGTASVLVARALVVGIDQDDLIGRPFSATTVRSLAREAGVPRKRPGPRRRVDRKKVAEVLAEMRDAPTVDPGR